MKRIAILALMTIGSAGVLAATTPPDLLNYQGVLRDSSGHPLDGIYSMIFRLFSAATGGDEILVDTHTGVTVTGGLFNVNLGGGVVADGAGPGTYLSLARVFSAYDELHLEIQVAGETLSPRVALASAGHALNARYVRGAEIVSDGPLDLYVDAALGDDRNDGLAPARAKKTIQAAVDAAPLALAGMVTIHIADGTYNESVLIDRRLMRAGGGWIILQGNEASPQNVVLDGEGTRQDGIMVLGFAEIRGIKVTNFVEEGIEADFGLLFVDNCRVEGNSSAGTWYAGIAVYEATADIANTAIVNNASIGVDVGENGGNVSLKNCQITGNGGTGLNVDALSFVAVDGSLLIQGNGGMGVVSKDGSYVDFNGRADVTVQANAGGSMQASYHGTIRGYGSGTTGGCVAGDAHSMCVP